MALTVLEICAGGGGQAAGLEGAGFDLAAAVELDHSAFQTLRNNRPCWKVIEGSVQDLQGSQFRGVDLFPEALRLYRGARLALEPINERFDFRLRKPLAIRV